MDDKDLFREVARKVSKIVWRLVGICIILATIVAVILYCRQQKIKEMQVGHEQSYLTVTDAQAYCAIAWEYTVESDIVYGQAE